MDEITYSSRTGEGIQRLQNSLARMDTINADLAHVVRSLLGLHVGRLDRFVSAAQSLLDNGEDLSRENIMSLLCSIVVLQQNH